jgi:hypothetical protein
MAKDTDAHVDAMLEALDHLHAVQEQHGEVLLHLERREIPDMQGLTRRLEEVADAVERLKPIALPHPSRWLLPGAVIVALMCGWFLCWMCVAEKEGWTWRVLGMIDEVPGLKRLNILSEGLNYFAGYGVRLALITPSMEELIDKYGVHHNFLEGCKVQVIFGMHDARVAEIFSKRVGAVQVTKKRYKEALLSDTALMNLAEDKALVIVGRQKVIAHKTYYKDHAPWAARSQL